MSTSANNNGRPSVTWADVADYANEALLSDLQRTTEVLKQAKFDGCCSSNITDLEPVYQEQTRSYGNSFHVLDNIEQMLDDYSQKRRSPEDECFANSLTNQAERPTVQSLFRELEHDSYNRNAGGHLSQSFGNIQMNFSSFSIYPSYSNTDKCSFGTANFLNLLTHTETAELADRRSVSARFDVRDVAKDMSKHGINTIPKGDCASCGSHSVGQNVASRTLCVLSMWEELGHQNFFERGGKAYCENDYHNMFSPRCAYCNGPIKDRCVTALGKTFHAEHFICAECGQQFGEEGFHEKNGQPYCKTDFFRMFAPKCNGCKNPIKMHFITALGTHWHPECFICQECGKPFETGSFYEHGNMPLCEMHYHEKRGSLCATCQKPINGRCVFAVGQKFHPEHFCCSYCRRQLNKGTFKEVDRKPFCHKCYQTTHH
ncbi:Paxillin [Dirofilaria immitis]|nr:Paxillin [Dirofilaria immitis]